MTDPDGPVREELAATLDRAGFEGLSPGDFRVEVTDSFRRRLGECRSVDQFGEADRYEIRIASRLFDDEIDADYVLACPNGCFSVGYGEHCEETRPPGPVQLWRLWGTDCCVSGRRPSSRPPPRD
jgi:hypothetical protein